MSLDDALLAEIDAATQSLDTSRSALIRMALASYLAPLRTKRLERQHREAYERRPQEEDDLASWEALEAWDEA